MLLALVHANQFCFPSKHYIHEPPIPHLRQARLQQLILLHYLLPHTLLPLHHLRQPHILLFLETILLYPELVRQNFPELFPHENITIIHIKRFVFRVRIHRRPDLVLSDQIRIGCDRIAFPGGYVVLFALVASAALGQHQPPSQGIFSYSRSQIRRHRSNNISHRFAKITPRHRSIIKPHLLSDRLSYWLSPRSSDCSDLRSIRPCFTDRRQLSLWISNLCSKRRRFE